MSNQSVNGFQGSQPFITDKQFQNLSLDEIRHIIAQEKEELKKDYKELGERRKLIKKYKKLIAARQDVKQGIAGGRGRLYCFRITFIDPFLVPV